MSEKYSRTNFFDTVIDLNNIYLTDPTSFTFKEFIEFMRSKVVALRRISESEAGSPELISFQHYGDHSYWWIILLVNKIQDPINELVAGMEIAVPLLRDIEEFRQKTTLVKSRGQTVILR